ncbi:hypothetical protein R3I94_003816 [Phoxinus phoxinus]
MVIRHGSAPRPPAPDSARGGDTEQWSLWRSGARTRLIPALSPVLRLQRRGELLPEETSDVSQCMSSTTIVLEIGGSSLKIKKKECVDDCRNGSMNSGVTKTAFSCCGTDFCNAEDAPDPRLSAPTGRKCYYCDGQSCRNTVSCAGTEDGCITATVINRGTPTLLKGCITKSICGLLKCSFIQDLSCCEGDLCNGDKGLTPGAIYNADKSLNLSAVQSFTYKGPV